MRLYLPLMVLIAGCGSDFENAAFVDGLRLLGARSQPAEAGPGESVALTAWAVDPSGQAITVAWGACLAAPLPGSGQLDPSCILADGGAPLAPLGDGATPTATVPAYDPAQLGPPDITGGLYLPLVIHLTTDDDALDGVYRLRAPDGQPRNQNPTLAGLFVLDASGNPSPLDESTPYPVHAGDRLTLAASFTPDSAESYQVILEGAPPRTTTETLSVVWYSTGGHLDDETTGANVPERLTLDRHVPASGGTIDVWVVGQDERGGADLLHRTLIVQ